MQNLSFNQRRGHCFVPQQANEIMGLPMTLSKESHLVKVAARNGVEGKRNQKRQCWGMTKGRGGSHCFALWCFTVDLTASGVLML